MRDPHVQRLHYDLVPCDELITFRDPPTVVWETPESRITLEGGHATVELLQHYATIEEAQAVVEPRLLAWEITAGLDAGFPLFRFAFHRATVIERAPIVEDSSQYRQIRVVDTATLSVTQSAIVSRRYDAYPVPPAQFDASLGVEMMWRRWEGYRAGREPLAAMAYWCLTVLEVSARRRDKAAKRYGVAQEVLRELGRLTSTVGDQATARKADVTERRSHTPTEVRWIEEFTKALICRAGEWAAAPGATLRQITMADFPGLSEDTSRQDRESPIPDN